PIWIPDGVVTGFHSTTTWSRGSLAPSDGWTISGPSGKLWVSVASPVMVLPSIVVPRNEYTPAGKSALNCSIGKTTNGGSLLSENGSAKPKPATVPAATTSRILSPCGLKSCTALHA